MMFILCASPVGLRPNIQQIDIDFLEHLKLIESNLVISSDSTVISWEVIRFLRPAKIQSLKSVRHSEHRLRVWMNIIQMEVARGKRSPLTA